MKHTEHYQLNQWEANGKVQRTDFNADNTKLDGALHRLAQEKAERGKVEELQSALAGKGNCRIVTGSYVGNGEYGTGICATSLDFAKTLGKAPELLIVRCSDTSPHGLVFLKGMTTAFYAVSHSWSSSYFLDLTWTATGVTWSGSSTVAQHTEKGKIYYYVAFG